MNQSLLTLTGVVASTGLPNLDGGIVLQILSFVVLCLIMANQGKSLFGKGTPFPQPLIIDQLKAMATRDEVEALETKVENEFGKQREIARTTVGNLHKRIDKSSEKLGELVGETKALNKNVELLITKQIK